MSNYHILNVSNDGNLVNVVMHFPVPDTNNAVGLNHRTVVQQVFGVQTSSVPFISGAEQTQLTAGELIEHSVQFYTRPGEDTAGKVAGIESLFVDEQARVLAELAYQLSYFGYSADVT